VKTRILLVDDHELMREGLRSILEGEENLEIVGEAATGRGAVERSRALGPDVVLMDVVMKEMNGIDATRQILEDRPNVKVIALSSHSDSRFVNAMLEAGACGYVLKANAYVELRHALDAAREGNGYLCAEVTKGVTDTLLKGFPRGETTPKLSAREREIVQLLAEGLSSPQIGRRLFVAVSTVETHRRNIMRKLDIHNLADLTKWAIREGLTDLES